MNALFFSVLSVTSISIISILAIYYLISFFPHFAKFSQHLVGIAVGSLLGDAFFHLLPQSSELFNNQVLVGMLVILGIIIFFSIEKFVRWRHCHEPECHEEIKNNHIVPVSLVGEAFHNFLDGVVIAGSFMVSFPLGLATSLAVLIHEIPQEIGDFGIYLHQGKTLAESLRLNLFSAIFSLIGVIVTFILGKTFADLSNYILPLTAGGFIYLASSDLIPELHRHESNSSNALSQIFLLVFGATIMALLLLLE